MKLDVLRYSDSGDDSLGLLFVAGQFFCYTMEDEYRNEKKYGETRIPAGSYDIGYRKIGGFHLRYSKRFPKMHQGMLQLKEVPNFEYILIHIGNRDEDTAGCLLVGDGANNNQIDKGMISSSTDAYVRLYPVICEALDAGGQVTIELTDLGFKKK